MSRRWLLWSGAGAAGATLALSHLAVPEDIETLRLSLWPDVQPLGVFEDPRTTGGLLAACFALWTLLHLLHWFRAAGHGSKSAWVVAALLAAGCLVAFPFVSGDVFLYAAHGATWIQHDANPYLMAPADLPGHPLARCGPWCEEPAFYGPLAVFAGAGLFLAAGSGWELLLLSRLLALACMAGAFVLADRIHRWTVGELSDGSRWLLMAASPLVLLEAGVAAHNDAWVALLVLAFVYFLLRLRLELALPLLGAAVAIKYTSLIFVPAVLVFLWRQERRRELLRRLVIGSFLAACLVTILAWPFGWSILRGIEAASDQATRSPIWAFGWLLGGETSIAGFGRGLACILALLLALRVRTVRDLPRVLCATYLGLLLVGTAWFQPWYLLPLLPLALASDEDRLRDVAMVFAASALLGLYGIFFLTYSWEPGVLLVMTLVSFVPVFTLLAGAGLAGRRRALASQPGSE